MELLKNIKEEEVMFLDIETARVSKTLKKGTPEWDAWSYKHNKDGSLKDAELRDLYKDKAALEAEFARVVTISVGMIVEGKLVVRSYYDQDEAKLLRDFNHDLELTKVSVGKIKLCGWALIGFDIPFIFKRCMAKRVTPSPLLEVAGEKPWTLAERVLDLKDLWRGTSFGNTSLIAASVCLGVPHPKDDISGADVGRVYYEEGQPGLERIKTYCEKDVLSTANVFRALRFEPIIGLSKQEQIIEEVPLIRKLANGLEFGESVKKKVRDLLNDLPHEEIPHALEVLHALGESKKSKVTRSFVRSLKEEYAETA